MRHFLEIKSWMAFSFSMFRKIDMLNKNLIATSKRIWPIVNITCKKCTKTRIELLHSVEFLSYSAYVCTKHDDLRQNLSIELDCIWFGNFCKSGKKEKRGIAKTNFGNSHFCPVAVRVHKKWWFATNISIELDCVNGCFHFWKSDQTEERICIAGKWKCFSFKKFDINSWILD